MNRKMKDSGVEWIGEIPEDWEVSRVKNIAKIFTGNSISDKDKNNYNDLRNSIPYISTKNINLENSSIEYDTGIYIKNEDTKFKVAKKSSILLCIEGGSAGKKIAILNQKVAFVNKLCCFEVFNLNNKYAFYYLSSYAFKEQFNQYISGLIGGVSQNYIKNFNILIPSKEIQKLIAETLDRKCTQIDALIQNQKQQIEKLKQYKQSLITETVTKGLEPNVPMKDSGVEWIGEIPEDWGVSKIKYKYNLIVGFTPDTSKEYYYDDEYGFTWITISDMQENKKHISNSKLKISKNYIDLKSPKITKKGSLLYSFKLSIGKVVFADKDIYTNEAIISFEPNENINLNYLYYSSYLIQENSNVNIYGAKILNQELIKNAVIVFPPLLEQEKIANYLDKKCSRIDKLIKIKEEKIQKLNDYKKSIIYEYVTGKKEA